MNGAITAFTYFQFARELSINTTKNVHKLYLPSLGGYVFTSVCLWSCHRPKDMQPFYFCTI